MSVGGFEMPARVEEPKEILSEVELAVLLEVDVRTIRRARQRGEPIFPYVMVGDMPRYSRTVVLAQFAKWPVDPMTTIAAGGVEVVTRPKVGRPRKVS